VQDPVLKLCEEDGAHEFYYVYNAQAADAGSAWRLGWEQFTQLPSTTDPVGTTAVLTEADGHQTTYTLDQARSQQLKDKSGSTVFYFAPGLANGTPWLRFDYDNKQWIRYHPGTQITEIYNTQGYLVKRSDAQGRFSTFEYTNGQLSAVNAPSAQKFRARRTTFTRGSRAFAARSFSYVSSADPCSQMISSKS